METNTNFYSELLISALTDHTDSLIYTGKIGVLIMGGPCDKDPNSNYLAIKSRMMNVVYDLTGKALEDESIHHIYKTAKKDYYAYIKPVETFNNVGHKVLQDINVSEDYDLIFYKANVQEDDNFIQTNVYERNKYFTLNIGKSWDVISHGDTLNNIIRVDLSNLYGPEEIYSLHIEIREKKSDTYIRFLSADEKELPVLLRVGMVKIEKDKFAYFSVSPIDKEYIDGITLSMYSLNSSSIDQSVNELASKALYYLLKRAHKRIDEYESIINQVNSNTKQDTVHV